MRKKRAFRGRITDPKIPDPPVATEDPPPPPPMTGMESGAAAAAAEFVKGLVQTGALVSGAWNAGGPGLARCPQCGSSDLLGYTLIDETGAHQHTKYLCRSWIRPPEPAGGRRIEHPEDWGEPCGWEGWSVPGWDCQRQSAMGELLRRVEGGPPGPGELGVDGAPDPPSTPPNPA